VLAVQPAVQEVIHQCLVLLQ
jgi:hypothetical protein